MAKLDSAKKKKHRKGHRVVALGAILRSGSGAHRDSQDKRESNKHWSKEEW